MLPLNTNIAELVGQEGLEPANNFILFYHKHTKDNQTEANKYRTKARKIPNRAKKKYQTGSKKYRTRHVGCGVCCVVCVVCGCVVGQVCF